MCELIVFEEFRVETGLKREVLIRNEEIVMKLKIENAKRVLKFVGGVTDSSLALLNSGAEMPRL